MRQLLAVLMSLALMTSTLTAQQSRESLSAAAIRYGRELAAGADAPLQTKGDWGKVRNLEPGSSVRVTMRDGVVREGRLGVVTDDHLLLESDGAPIAVEIKRDEIAELQRPTRGSLPGALLGVALGGLAGVGTAVNLAFKQCGGSCNDEKFLMVASLVGMPLAGGYAGAKVMPRPKWTTVYRR